MRILIVSITPNSAVDRLALQVQKYNEHLFIDVMPFHPKRYSQDDLKIFEEKARDADLIDFEYWKNALVLLEKFPWLKDKLKILTHHNPYDLHQNDWRQFNAVIVKNKTQMKELPNTSLIPHSVDLNFFKFNQDYKDKTVGMVAFRIEGKKGIREVAQVCKELGYRFLLVGRVSRPEYIKEIKEIGVEFRENQTDEQVRDAYKEMSVLVCNSVDEFESGTLPILEAMASGVPVLTRNIGLVPDIYNERNLVVRNGQQEDVGDLKWELKTLMENKERRLDLREAGWQTIKNMSAEKSARQYAWIYNKVMFNEPLVSVIIPTYNKKEQVIEILKSLSNQNYENIEAVVCVPGITEIDLKNGSKQIKEIKKGDLVRTHTGQFCKVKRLMKRKYWRLLKKITALDCELSLTPEHLIFVFRKEKYQWIKAQDIKKSDLLIWNIKEENKNPIVDINQKGYKKFPDKIQVDSGFARLLGFFASEGCIRNESNIGFTFNSLEVSYIEETIDLLKRYFGKSYLDTHHSWATSIFLASVGIYETFKDWFGKGALNKRIPKFIFNSDAQIKANFLDTLFLGDGHIYKSGAVVLSSASEQLVKDTKELCESLSINIPSVKKYVIGKESFGESIIYRMYVKKEGMNKIKSLIKAKKIDVGLYGFQVKKISKKMNYTGKVYNLEVERDNSYVANSIIVHNCDDNSDDGTEQAIKQMREQVQYPIKFLNTKKSGYNLAMARNKGVIEAEGEVLVFCDSRLKPHLDAIYQFMKFVIKNKDKIWYFGDKGGGKKGFVENWSAIRKYQLVAGGIFSERMDKYGGMTQELNLRFGKQGFKFRYLPFARAKEIKSSRAKKTKKDDIYKSKLKLFKMYGN